MEFTAWPKTPRLFRDAVITEKIDGTNAAVVVERHPFGAFAGGSYPDGVIAGIVGDARDEAGEPVDEFLVGAQSRSRLLGATKQTDNMGFGRWVEANAADLVRVLGEGVHFGEWWGNGIQRGYGLPEGDKRFSLFNVHRYGKLLAAAPTEIPGLGLVPVLDAYTFSTERTREVLARLAETGSQAAPGFMRPEGVIVFHSQSRSVYKALLENDDVPKGAVS